MGLKVRQTEKLNQGYEGRDHQPYFTTTLTGSGRDSNTEEKLKYIFRFLEKILLNSSKTNFIWQKKVKLEFLCVYVHYSLNSTYLQTACMGTPKTP